MAARSHGCHCSAADRAFELDVVEARIAPGDFDHASHLRLAYVLLCEHAPVAAALRLKALLLAFLQAHGVGAGKYHETLTLAWLCAVEVFMARGGPFDHAADFLAANPALGDNDLLLTHYSRERLYSDAARHTALAPDRQPIPGFPDNLSG